MNLRLAVVSLVCVSTAAFAQTSPPPSPPYPAPIQTYIGRYLDSAQTNDDQNPARTLRARFAKVYPDHDLILMAISGSRFGVYQASTFPTRVASGPLATGTFGEKYLAPDVSVDPDAAGSGWIAPFLDGQDRLFDFDVDDRGYYYLGYVIYGFGITDANGHLLAQPDPAAYDALAVIAVRLGNSYYAVVSDGISQTRVYDVTNATAPVLIRTLPTLFQRWTRTSTGLALIVGKQIQVFTPDALVTGGTPFATLSPGGAAFDAFYDVTTDGATLYATKGQSGAFSIAILMPSGGGFAETDVPLAHQADSIDYGAGYLGVVGIGGFVGPLLFGVNGTSLTPYDLTAYFHANSPPFYTTARQVVPFSVAGTTYMLGELNGLGDLYSLVSSASALPALSTVALLALLATLALLAAHRLR